MSGMHRKGSGTPMKTRAEFLAFCVEFFGMDGSGTGGEGGSVGSGAGSAGHKHSLTAAPIGTLRIDSRSVTPGDIFIAMKGTASDGHAYIGQALDLGATLILCDPSYRYQAETDGLIERAPFVFLPNLRAALGSLAQAVQGYPAKDLTVIGVTGTNGKTTVSTLIWQWLRVMDVPCSLMGTVATRILDEEFTSEGTGASMTTSDPIHLAQMMRLMVDRGSTHLAMEVSSHALDQDRIGGIDVKAAIFTNLTHDHLDYHGTLERYRDSKKRLFDGLQPDAVAVFNLSDSSGFHMARDCEAGRVIGCRFTSIGASANASTGATVTENIQRWNGNLIDIIVDDASPSSRTDIAQTSLIINGTSLRTSLIGSYNMMNLAQAFICLEALGFDANALAKHAPALKGAPGRLERVSCSSHSEGPLVYVDYAHTPDALENVIHELSEWIQSTPTNHHLWVVFGCGGDRDRTKRPVMGRIAQSGAFGGIITSDNPRSEDPNAILQEIWAGLSQPAPTWQTIEERHLAISTAIQGASETDIVLIAGKGHETTQEIKGVKYPFDDREVAKEVLCGRGEQTHHHRREKEVA